jgi:predicted MFS family arabinose efflux permease
VASSTANGILPVAESFAVLQVTGSAGKLGIVLACQGAVALLLSLAGGLAGDRFPRGRILIASSVARMAAAAALSVTLLTHTASFGVLLAGAVGYGAAGGFFGPVSAAVLPDIAAPGQLAAANALIGGVSSSAAIIAPAIAGVIVAALGAGSGFACEAAVLAVMAGFLAAARLPARRAGRPADGHVLGQLRAGWKEFARLRWLWLLTLQWTLFSLLILAPVAVLGPTIAERFLGGPAAWGIISSCLALGAVGGQLAAGRLRPVRPAMVAACLVPVMIAEALALGLGAPVPVVAAAATVTGLAMGIYAVIFQTMMQTAVPAAVLARVSAFDLLGSELAQPAGYALAGPSGTAVGLHTFLAAGSAVVFLGAVVMTLPRSLRDRALAYGSRSRGRMAEPAGVRHDREPEGGGLA